MASFEVGYPVHEHRLTSNGSAASAKRIPMSKHSTPIVQTEF